MILNVVPAELAVVGNFDIIFHFLFAEPVATTNREGYSISISWSIFSVRVGVYVVSPSSSS